MARLPAIGQAAPDDARAAQRLDGGAGKHAEIDGPSPLAEDVCAAGSGQLLIPTELMVTATLTASRAHSILSSERRNASTSANVVNRGTAAATSSTDIWLRQ